LRFLSSPFPATGWRGWLSAKCRGLCLRGLLCPFSYCLTRSILSLFCPLFGRRSFARKETACLYFRPWRFPLPGYGCSAAGLKGIFIDVRRGLKFQYSNGPDKHTIEVGENMSMVVKRFIVSGLSVEETAALNHLWNSTAEKQVEVCPEE